MTRALAVVAALALVALGWQSWRFNSAIHNIRNSPLINFFFISVCSL